MASPATSSQSDEPPLPFPVRVARHRLRGRELRTSESVPRGAVLLRNLPFALVPCDAQLARLCAGCLASEALTACAAGCGMRLCPPCAVEPRWLAAHEGGECFSLKQLWALLACPPGGVGPETAGLRLLLRCVYVQGAPQPHAAAEDAEDAVADGPDSLSELLSHWEALPAASAAAAEALAATARRLLLASSRRSREALSLLAADLACNSFDLVDAESGDSLGEGLFPSLAVCVNHSCRPSADFVLESGPGGGALALRALRPLARNQPVTIGYCNLFTAAEQRRAHLRSTYCFDCDCARCRAGAGAPGVPPLARALRAALPGEEAAAADALAAAVLPLVEAGEDWARLTLARARAAQLRARPEAAAAAELAGELEALLGRAHPFTARVRAVAEAGGGAQGHNVSSRKSCK